MANNAALAAAQGPSSSNPHHGVESLYEEIGPGAYEAVYVNYPPQAASIKWVISQLEAAQIKPAKVLDIGCGTGRPVCAEFAAAGHDVLGIDVSSAMLAFARKNVPGVKFEQMDARDFSAPSASLDAITIYFSMITDVSQDDIREMIRKIHTWLKPGGVFVFMTALVVGNNVQVSWMGRVRATSGLPSDEALEWIRKVGFEVVHADVIKFTPTKAVEIGICGPEDIYEEEHQIVYAKKPTS